MLVAENVEHSGCWDDADGCISFPCGSGDWFLNEVQRIDLMGRLLNVISSATTPPQITSSNTLLTHDLHIILLIGFTDVLVF